MGALLGETTLTRTRDNPLPSGDSAPIEGYPKVFFPLYNHLGKRRKSHCGLRGATAHPSYALFSVPGRKEIGTQAQQEGGKLYNLYLTRKEKLGTAQLTPLQQHSM